MKPIVIFILLSLLLIGCKDINPLNGCSKFLGDWKSERSNEFKIYKDGESFIFDGHLPEILGDYKSGLDCDDGKLVLKGIPMMGELSLTLLQDGSILLAGKTFNKVNGKNQQMRK